VIRQEAYAQIEDADPIAQHLEQTSILNHQSIQAHESVNIQLAGFLS
jgi:hypothetical protein